MEVGFRVIRGPDWKWGEQDGGEGYAGTVVEAGESVDKNGRQVIVQWDCEGRCMYRCGAEGKYDLRVLDTAPTPGYAHPNVSCTWCEENPLAGIAWKCTLCYDYYLCTRCYMAGKHSVEHPFDRCQTKNLKERVRMSARFMAKRLPVMGTFPEAMVVRGVNWRWGNQDGGRGNTGHVTAIQKWKMDTFRSVAAVCWKGDTAINVYRRAHGGKVDLKCVKASSGGHCYVEDLPLFGFKYEFQEDDLSAGASAMVQIDPDVFKIAQEDHGGWSDDMAEFIGQVGVVKNVDYTTGDMHVHYSGNQLFFMNKDVLTRVEDIPVYHYGDIVRVIDDISEVYMLQAGHGEWNDDIALALGQLGRVTLVSLNYDIRVMVNGGVWQLNPKCVRPAPGESLPKDDEIRVGGRDQLMAQLKILVDAQLPNIVPAAAAAGDVDVLCNHLDTHPQDVNDKIRSSESALHIAITKGYPFIVKAILQYNPDLNIQDSNGERPLHSCVRLNDVQSAKALIDAGADVNATNFNSVSPIVTAAALGHSQVLKYLVTVPGVNLDAQDNCGTTGLHRAVTCLHRDCVRILLEHGASPTLHDQQDFTPLHSASVRGYLSVTEEILHYCPQHINIKKEDGYTPLHIAVVNNHCDLVFFLASHPQCDINNRNCQNLTALHLAAIQGNIFMIESLVGYGADVNATFEGHSTTHVILNKTGNMKQPSEKSPQMKKIQDEIEASHGKGVVSADIVATLFLAANGVDIHMKNTLGQSPLGMCPRDIAPLFKEYAERSDSFHGSLKELPHPFSDSPRPMKKQPAAQVTTPPTRRHTDTQVAPPSSSLPLPSSSPAPPSSSPAPPSASPAPPTRSVSVPAHANGDHHGAHNNHNLAGKGHTQNQACAAKDHTQNQAYAAKDHTQSRTSESHAKDHVGKDHTQNGAGAGEETEGLNDVNTMLQTITVTEEKTAAPKDMLHCFLCDGGADAELQPCGHVAMCHTCAPRVKKCPQCRNPVDAYKPVCVLCQSKDTIIPFRCGHAYCKGCRGNLDSCEACRREQC